jgi:Mn2+/Fe2+ NRAMP family transporter
MIENPPKGKQLLKVLGPGLVWSASAIGVSELVFATRAGALFGYLLLWAPIVSLIMKYAIFEMAGRYTIATGENVLIAFTRVELDFKLFKLKTGWIIVLFWIVFIASVSGMAGIALSVGSCIYGIFPAISMEVATVCSIVIVGIVLYVGSYTTLENASRILVLIMVLFLIYALAKTSPNPKEIAEGLIPRAPFNTMRELVPLLGWSGAGAIGVVWYSLWVEGSTRGKGNRTIDSDEDKSRIKKWIKINQIDLTINTIITALLTVMFLIAGVLILHPKGMVPQGEKLALQISQIAGENFGRIGEIIFLVGIFGTLFSTLLANIDGLCRVASNSVWYQRRKKDDTKLHYYRLFVIVYVLSTALFSVLFPAPVILLQISAVIDTIFLPLIIGLGIYICHKHLEAIYRPGKLLTITGVLSVLFFVFFIVLFFYAVIMKVDFSM